MKIVEKKENKELIYELSYDKETIKSLIKEIIENCSVRKRHRASVEARTLTEAKELIDSARDYCGNKIYENVADIKKEPVNDPLGYWRPGDPVYFSFESDILISPGLAIFLINILEEKGCDYDWFINRKELNAEKQLQLDIQNLDKEINNISNFDTEIKIAKLQELSFKLKQLNIKPIFDYEKLSNYYLQVEKCIHLELVQEIITYQKKYQNK